MRFPRVSPQSRIALGVAATLAIVLACSRSAGAPRSAASRGATGAGVSATQTAARRGPSTAGIAPADTISDRADRGRIVGDPTAPIWIVMASDFECPYCKQWTDTVFPLIDQNYIKTGRVRLAYLNYPIRQHLNGVPAAEAAMCASVQGKFWPMHDALFATQEAWESLANPQPKFDSLATGLGVAMRPWRQCVNQHLTRPLIQADHDRAANAGVNSTPTFFVGKDSVIIGDQPYAQFKAALDAELAKVPAKPPARVKKPAA
jgi:protein-disulfide isomerase